jgi:hypothetical protein
LSHLLYFIGAKIQNHPSIDFIISHQKFKEDVSW